MLPFVTRSSLDQPACTLHSDEEGFYPANPRPSLDNLSQESELVGKGGHVADARDQYLGSRDAWLPARVGKSAA